MPQVYDQASIVTRRYNLCKVIAALGTGWFLMATIQALYLQLSERMQSWPQVAEMVFERSKLLKWMLGRLRPREFDSNKQSTAELLAILLQNSPKNQQRLADANGIDALLQAHSLHTLTQLIPGYRMPLTFTYQLPFKKSSLTVWDTVGQFQHQASWAG